MRAGLACARVWHARETGMHAGRTAPHRARGGESAVGAEFVRRYRT